jgi:hypothetical protein
VGGEDGANESVGDTVGGDVEGALVGADVEGALVIGADVVVMGLGVGFRVGCKEGDVVRRGVGDGVGRGVGGGVGRGVGLGDGMEVGGFVFVVA